MFSRFKKIGLITVLFFIIGGVFIGGGSALPSTYPDTSLYYYENIAGSSGIYSYLETKLNLSEITVLNPPEAFPSGPYTNESLLGIDSFYLGNLTAKVAMEVLDENGNPIASGINGEVPQHSKIRFEVVTPYSKGVGLKFASPKGTSGTTYLGTENMGVDGGWYKKSKTITLDENLTEGTWMVWPYFETRNQPGYIVPYAPDSYINGQPVIFTIVSDSVSVDVAPQKVTVGNDVKVTITGKPGDVYRLKENEKYMIVPGQDRVEGQFVTIGPNGKTDVYIRAVKDGVFNLQVYNPDNFVEDDVELTFLKSKLTANSKESSYYMGNDIKLYGTNERGDNLYYYLEGTNQKFSPIPSASLKYDRTGEIWNTTIKGSYISTLKLDTGSYTIYVSSVNGTDKDYVLNRSGISASAAVTLIQPKLSLSSVPSVVVQGDDLKVKGVAEGNPAEVMYYIFGTNKFFNSTVDVGKSGSFTIEKTLDKDEFAPGQYYLVVQHPMYDKVFNVGPVRIDGDYKIVVNKTGSYFVPPYTILFSINDRQSANAAQALCDAIDSENIDDFEAKCSFIVSATSTVVDTLPAEVAKYTPFVVSGITNERNGDPIRVELLSTAFNSASKYSASSSSFISLVTEPDEDGRWSVTFDTSDLNLDTYTVNVIVNEKQSSNYIVKLVAPGEASPTSTSTPVVPTSQVKPTSETPQSPVPIAGMILAGMGITLYLGRRKL